MSGYLTLITICLLKRRLYNNMPVSYANYGDSVAVFPRRVEFNSDITARPGLLSSSTKGFLKLRYALEEDYLSCSPENLPRWEM